MTATRPAFATVVLGAIWLAFLGLLAAMVEFDPTVVPTWFYLPGVVVVLAFAAVLLASRRWDRVWRRGFVSTVPIPGWCWLAAGLLAVGTTVLSFASPIPLQGVLWLGLLSAGISYAAGTASGRDWLRAVARWPTWIAVSLAVVAAAVVGVAVVLDGGALLTVVLLLAVLSFSFYVCFVLPLTLYHAATEDGPGTSADDGSAAGASGNGVRDVATLPPVSVVIPAFDEEGFVGDCVESVLASNYPPELLEIVVIDDGSTDGTFEEAATYRDYGVRVFSRDNGGKHAALNMGLQCTSSPVVVTVDADSRPLPDAIPKAVRQLQASPSVGALSPTVVATEGSGVLADGFLAGLQRLEYALSNTNRRAYSIFGAVPVVPGCLGVYRREALEDVWGYDPDTVTEDFDVTVQLLRHGWKVRHGPGTVLTVVPGGWRALWRQRLRWYRGSLETLRKHRDVFLSPRYGYLHALSLPTRLVAQLFGPVASLVILFAVGWGLLTGPSVSLLVLVGIFLLLTVLIGLFSLVLEGEPLSYVLYAPLLFVGYKHFVDCTVGVGTIRAFLADRRW